VDLKKQKAVVKIIYCVNFITIT